jgi:ribonucleotide monophosphatase NagD (HAD superfamily)
VDAGRSIIIGDRLATDVGMGLATGMTGALALTGATTRADVDASDIRPDYLLNSLYDLLNEFVDEGSVP